MAYEGIKIKETRTCLIVTFSDCKCSFEFDKYMMSNNKMSIKTSYCSKYPSCRKAITAVFDQARAKLLSEAVEAQLVILD
jgi:hypothetical protein